MSTLIHCDGPDCAETSDPRLPDMRRLGEAGWVRLEEGPDRYLRDFHSTSCLCRWAEQNGAGTSPRDEPCTCRRARNHPHTKAEHRAYPHTEIAGGPESHS